MISPRALRAASLALALVGIGLRVRPPRPTMEPSTLAAPVRTGAASVPRSAATLVDQRTYAPIVATDIFSPTRSPPNDRFVPEPTSESPTPSPAAPAGARDAPPVPRLLGTTIGPDDAVALLAAGPEEDARLVRVGDRAFEGSVAAISESTVVIARAKGRLVLHLPSMARGRP